MAYKFYWIKLMQDFYEQKEIKKMRTMPAGDTLVIIYQRMQLLSLKNNGVIAYEGIEEDLAAELALQLSENINNVRLTLEFLIRAKLIGEIEPGHWEMKKIQHLIGGESESAARVRKYRERRAAAGLPDNTRRNRGVTNELPGNVEPLQCNNDVTQIEQFQEIETAGGFEKICSSNELSENTEATQIEENAINEVTETKKADAVPYAKITELYHSICKSYPRIVKIEGTRKKAVAARWHTYGGAEGALEVFEQLFKKTEASLFLKGGNEKNWRADFDWIMKPSNMAKVLEGKYDNRKTEPEKREVQQDRYQLTGFTRAN